MKKNIEKFDPIVVVKDDGLTTPEVGTWAEQKLNYFGHYCNIFTKSMRQKWDTLVYVDLFSCTGYSRIRSTDKIIMGSPMISLALQTKFDKYIFCEKEEQNYNVLEKRINREYPEKECILIKGDCNEKVDEIISHIPQPSKDNTVLTFCFVDPYSLSLHFDTIRKLSIIYVDFLIHFSDMDAKLNRHNYIEKDSDKIDLFLGSKNWRPNYNNNENFLLFLFKEFTINMKNLKYKEPTKSPQIRSDRNNLGLYHLVFYSRHSKGNEIWKKIQNSSNPQQSLGF